ncbi:MAG TPA: hydrogenase nickel incorporation protein HypB [Gemmatimonadaceae bacterium]|jgi:hydrogenase nickel incorporation protein HypB
MSPRIVEIRQNVLKQNDLLARELRRRYATAGTFVVNLVSGPGSGKTALLEATLAALRHEFRVAALTGDLATDNDARRLARAGVPVRQISTGTICHLDASMIVDSLAEWDLAELDFLFVENVGNLVCPASYDLGENLRVVLLAVTEGEDKPLKYPTIFNSADIAVITKSDLARAVEFDRDAAYANIRSVGPALEIVETSARTGDGLDAWLSTLIQHMPNHQPPATSI